MSMRRYTTDELYASEMGQVGIHFENGLDAVTGTFVMLEVITAATFSAITIAGASGDALTGVSFPAGTQIRGHITGFTLSAGSVIAYKGA